MFLSSLDVYEAWYYVWYAWLAAVLQRVASVAFGREIVAHSKAHTYSQSTGFDVVRVLLLFDSRDSFGLAGGARRHAAPAHGPRTPAP